MELMLVVISSLFLLFISMFLYRGTPLDFNPRNGSVWCLLYYKSLILILLPLILVQIYPLSELSHNPPTASRAEVNQITLYSISALLVFTLSTSLFLRWSKAARSAKLVPSLCYKYKPSVFFGWLVAIIALAIFSFAIIFLGHSHALIKALISGENLLTIRLMNSYNSDLPSQASAFFSLAYKITAISAGIALAKKHKYTAGGFLFISFFISSIDGSKAPLVTVIVMFTLSYLVISPLKFKLKTVFWYFLVYPVSVISIIFVISSYQIPNLDMVSFAEFIFKRLGFGQMSGTFNTFTLPPFEGDYYWHTVPFASLIIDYPIYQKDLMLYVMQAEFDETGMQNSLFIAEAFGIGGFSLAMLSPIIVGCNYAFGLIVFYIFMKYAFNDIVGKLYAVPIYISTLNLTGGFSSFALFKGLLLLIILFIPVVVIWNLLYRPSKGKSPTIRS